ncbi:major facilitator superfamily protein, partial [Kipferlia bialata]|eukprot:g8417.t1
MDPAPAVLSGAEAASPQPVSGAAKNKKEPMKLGTKFGPVKVAALCCWPVLVQTIDQSVFNVSTFSIQSQTGLQLGYVQWFLVIVYLICASFTVLGGKLGDRYGANKIVMIGLYLTLGAQICAYLVPAGIPEGETHMSTRSFAVMLFFRGIFALGLALSTSNSTAMLRHLSHRQHITVVFVYFTVATALPMVLFPTIGGWLAESALGWKALYLASLPFNIIALFLYATKIPPLPSSAGTSFDVLGSALTIVCMFLPIYGVSALSIGQPVSVLLLCIVGMFCILPLLLKVEARATDPVIPVEVIKQPRIGGSLVSFMLGWLGMNSGIYMVPYAMQ